MSDIQSMLWRKKEYVVKSYLNGASTCELGKELGCSNAAVYLFLRDDCHVEMRKRPTINEYKDKIIELYNKNYTCGKIARELNLNYSTLYRYIKKLNLDTSRFSDQREDPLINHIDEITKLYKEGMGCYKLAKKYKCHETSIIRLLRKNSVETGQYLVHYDVNHKFFDNIDTQEKAYVYGFFVGDGYNYQKNGVVAIGITDLDILRDIKNVMNFTGRIHETDYNDGHRKIRYNLYIGSRYMSNRLAEIGCPQAKSFITHFPSDDVVPRNLMRHYLRGLLDADGSLYHNKYKRLYCVYLGSEKLMQGIRQFLQQEINVNFHIYPHRKIYMLRLCRQDEVETFLNYIYHNSTIYLSRKHNLALPFLQK